MLREFVAPESRVVLVLRDPIIVHVIEQIVLAEWLEEGADVGAIVSWDRDTVGLSSGSIGRWDWIVLASEIAILGVRTVTEV